MRLVRSWPAVIPEDRAYVVDGIERLVMGDTGRNYDYRCLADLDDDVVLIEWDIAIGGDQLARFIARCAEEPDRVRVAPYLLYRSNDPNWPFYVHRVRMEGTKRWVRGPEDTHCQMFGFGLTYLPRGLILGFVATLKEGDMFSDTTFSRWHMRHSKNKDVAIDWDCHAVHLHSSLPAVP